MPAPKGNKNASKPDDEKKTSFLYIRTEPEVKASWVKAAMREKKKLSAWVTETLNAAADKP